MHYIFEFLKNFQVQYQQRQKNGKESRKHLKLGGISPTVAERSY